MDLPRVVFSVGREYPVMNPLVWLKETYNE